MKRDDGATRRTTILSRVARNTRTEVGSILVVVVAVGLLLPSREPVQWWAWSVVGAAAVLFGLSARPRLARFLDVGGGVVATVLIGLLIAATGGHASAFQDLFVVVLAFDGAVRSTRRLAADTVVVALAAFAPAVYDTPPSWFYGDAVVDLASWLGVALLVRVLTGRFRAALQRNDTLAAIIEDTGVAVVGEGHDGTITSWNPAAAGLFGWTAAEAVGLHVSRLVPEDDREEHGRLFGQVVQGARVTYETRRLHADGSEIPVEATLSPIRDDGEVVGVAALYRDLRERLEWEERVARGEQRLRTFGELADGIVYRTMLEPDLRVDYVGPAIEPITGFTPQDFYEDDQLPMRRAHPDDLDLVRVPRQAHLSEDDEAGRVVYRFLHADGHWVWLEDHFKLERDEDGRPVSVQGIVFDVSAREEAERAQERALEREQEASERLAATVRMQRTFLQAVSHELRTPLTAITGFARTLRSRHNEVTSEQRQRLLDRLEHNATRLQRLLIDLLDVDRLSRGAMEPHLTNVDLGGLCLNIAEEVDVGERSVNLAVEGAPTIVADAAKLERIVENLLRNAVKHTPPGTTISIWFTEEQGNVVLTVEDDGPGIPDDVAQEVFEPFRQGPTAATDPSPGTGVGLAIVAQFADLHGGRAWYEPRPGGGSRFRVRIPRAPNVPTGEDDAPVSTGPDAPVSSDERPPDG